MEEQSTETQNKHEPKLMKTVASNTKLKRVFEFIQQFKDGITNKIQKRTSLDSNSDYKCGGKISACAFVFFSLLSAPLSHTFPAMRLYIKIKLN